MKKQYCLWIIGILLCIPFQFVEAQQNGHVRKEIAIQLYSVRDLINGVNQQGKASEVYLQTLKKLADMGYTAIEAALPITVKASSTGVRLLILSATLRVPA